MHGFGAYGARAVRRSRCQTILMSTQRGFNWVSCGHFCLPLWWYDCSVERRKRVPGGVEALNNARMWREDITEARHWQIRRGGGVLCGGPVDRGHHGVLRRAGAMRGGEKNTRRCTDRDSSLRPTHRRPLTFFRRLEQQLLRPISRRRWPGTSSSTRARGRQPGRPSPPSLVLRPSCRDRRPPGLCSPFPGSGPPQEHRMLGNKTGLRRASSQAVAQRDCRGGGMEA